MKLFHAKSRMDLHNHEYVVIDWFRTDREDLPGPVHELIPDYHDFNDEGGEYFKGAIKELFTADEIRKLRDYLKSRYGDKTMEVHEAKLPMEGHDIRTRLLPVGSRQGFIVLGPSRPNYPLDFQVSGYYDLTRAIPKPRDASPNSRKTTMPTASRVIRTCASLLAEGLSRVARRL